ncbi:MAG: NAD-dependent epimerase/dehydratase family protein [Chthoniobacterales bacterium]|nr:NAD-dependent epimerase/dehydratase family protein [Chthoniobacterales bacterium]
MKRVAITGARGRLAPGVAAFLGDHGWSAALFSRTASHGIREISSLASPAVLGEFDAVLHLGWSSVPLLSEESPGIEEREDFPFARALAAAVASCGNPPLLVFASSAAVYGNTGEVVADEQAPCSPLGRYAAAKLEAEQILSSAPRVCTLRITNVFGIGGGATRPQGIIPRLIGACRTGAEVTIWGEGNAMKDYLSVADLHEGILRILDAEVTGIFNVASGHVLSVNELIALVETAVGSPLLRVAAPPFRWDVRCSRISAAALQQRSGWAARIDPAQAIRQMARDTAT